MGLLATRYGGFDTIDSNVATNLREYREARDLSQDELAKLMTDRGFGFTQSTIWKIEQGKRPIKVNELVAFADALNLLNWTALLSAPEEASHLRNMELKHFQAGEAYRAVKDAAGKFLWAQIELAVVAHGAREANVEVADLWTAWLGVPAERAVIEARIEAEREEPVQLELHDAVAKVIAALRDQGYEPLVDVNDIQTIGPDTEHADPDPAAPTPT